jgi:dyslexia susceptibility 1 candidate gene 1 protein
MKELEKTTEKINAQLQAEWIGNRGRFFFKNEDYKSALHLYSLAIKQDPTNPVHYSNRALCYLKLEDYVQCVNDCNTALTVLSDEDRKKFDKITTETLNKEGAQEVMTQIPTNVLLTPSLQAKIYLRRARAYKALEEWEKSLMDYKRAHHLKPLETSLLKDIEELQPLVDEITKQRASDKSSSDSDGQV